MHSTHRDWSGDLADETVADVVAAGEGGGRRRWLLLGSGDRGW